MPLHISLISLLVSDYDEAIDHYVRQLGFTLMEDTLISEGKRWVIVAPSAGAQTGLLLAKAVGERQNAAIGQQSGGRVFLFLETDDFQEKFRAMSEAGIVFLESPRNEPYGAVAVFEDKFGNRWDLIERANPERAAR